MANVRIKDLPAFSGTLPTSAVFALETNQSTQKIDFATLKAAIGGGGESIVNENDVNFYDYEGTLVYSYSAAEFADLSEMPANPDHTSDGLTAQGWNWTLADAKSYVASYGMLNIGQIYITTDGKTHIYIHLEQGRTSPILGVCPNGTVDVDWGDNTTHNTLTGTSTSTVQWTPTHNYAAPGDYVIKLTVTGSMGFYGEEEDNLGLLGYTTSDDDRNSIYKNAILKIYSGSNITNFGSGAFDSCNNLTSITITNGITFIRDYAFASCCNLKSVTIPNGVTAIGSYAFAMCYNLKSVTIPNSITTYGFNNGLFYFCYTLKSITIPNGVKHIYQSTFYYCANLKNITIPNGVIELGDGLFEYCFSLRTVTIPNGVSAFTSDMLRSCLSMTSITIPSSVTSIESDAFSGCYGLAELHFQPTTPPTFTYDSQYNSIPSDCVIYVPAGSLSAYTSASGYPSSSTYTYIEE